MEISTTHATFSIGRTFDAPVEKVWQAFADKGSKEKWFKGPDSESGEHTMEFKVGGHETASGKFHDGVTHRFEADYYDIVPNRRIIYAYEMYLNGHRISVSLATLEFKFENGKTDLVLTENGVFLDGGDTVESRERGTQDLLDALGKSLS